MGHIGFLLPSQEFFFNVYSHGIHECHPGPWRSKELDGLHNCHSYEKLNKFWITVKIIKFINVFCGLLLWWIDPQDQDNDCCLHFLIRWVGHQDQEYVSCFHLMIWWTNQVHEYSCCPLFVIWWEDQQVQAYLCCSFLIIWWEDHQHQELFCSFVLMVCFIIFKLENMCVSLFCNYVNRSAISKIFVVCPSCDFMRRSSSSSVLCSCFVVWNTKLKR